MNVHINLLPEARVLKLRAQSRRRTAGTVTGLVCGLVGATIIVFGMLQVFLISTYGINQAKISDLRVQANKSHDMEQEASTLQEHLASFYTLNQNRLYASKIFINIGNAVPAGVSISTYQMTKDNIMTITGSASSFADVASFAKALEDYNVNYKPQPEMERKPLFTDISITTLSKDSSSNKVNYTMTFKVHTDLFKKPGGGQS